MTSLNTGNFNVDGVFVEYAKPLSQNLRLDMPPLLFVHGGFHGSWCWNNFMEYFAKDGWACYALNWYNHYNSKSLPLDQFVNRSIGDVTEEIGKVSDKIGDTPVLVGHSMGGLASQIYAAQASAVSLVLITPAGPAEIEAPPVNLPFPIENDQLFEPPPFEAAKELFFHGVNDDDALTFYQKLCPESPKAVSEATQYTLHINRSNVTCPVLIFGAELDQLSPPDVMSSLADFYEATYHYIPGKSHSLLVEPGWRDTAGLMQDWLVKHLPEQSS